MMQGGERSFRGNYGRGKFTPLTGELRGRTDKRCRDYETRPRPQQTYTYTCGGMRAMGILTCLFIDHGRTVVDLTQAWEQ